jgi:hypothetical protein
MESYLFSQRLSTSVWVVLIVGQVFGTWKLYWLLPMYAEEDLRKMTVLHGLDYPLRPDLDS